jgi:hypothetical protein
MPTMPPQQTFSAGATDAAERVEAVLVVAGRDHVAVELGRGVEVVVVVVEAGVAELLGLAVLQETQRRARLETQRLHGLDHLEDGIEVALLRSAPRGAHAEAARAGSLRGLRGAEHVASCISFESRPVVKRADCGAVAAVFRTAARLDGQQRRELHCIGVVMLPMHGLSTKQQIVKGQFKQRRDL